jgi:hypothetical protein
MAYRDPNAPIIARLFATNTPPNERIEIDSYRNEGPNTGSQIRFYKDGESVDRAAQLFLTTTGLDPSIQSVLQLFGSDLDGNADRAGINLYDMTDGTSELTLAADKVWLNNGIVQGPPFIRAWDALGNAPETWHAVAFTNGWGDLAGSRAGYMIDSSGVVHLRGLVIGGTAAAAIFTLPWAPTQTMDYTVRSNGGVIVCGIQVAANTGVVTASGNASTVSSTGAKLDVITFPTT